jgi:predicted ATPase
LTWGTLLQGWALAKDGQGETGIAQMHQGLVAYEATGAAVFRPSFLAQLVEAYGKGGGTQEGLRVLSETLAVMDNTGERWWEAELYRLKGELRAAMSLGRLWQRQGRRQEAQQLLAEIYGWFTEGFDTADVQEAKARLGELS